MIVNEEKLFHIFYINKNSKKVARHSKHLLYSIHVYSFGRGFWGSSNHLVQVHAKSFRLIICIHINVWENLNRRENLMVSSWLCEVKIISGETRTTGKKGLRRKEERRRFFSCMHVCVLNMANNYYGKQHMLLCQEGKKERETVGKHTSPRCLIFSSS